MEYISFTTFISIFTYILSGYNLPQEKKIRAVLRVLDSKDKPNNLYEKYKCELYTDDGYCIPYNGTQVIKNYLFSL